MRKILAILFIFCLASILLANINLEQKYTDRINDFFERYYPNYNYSVLFEFGEEENVKLNILLDENKFLESDVNFITAIIFMQLGLDRAKDKVEITFTEMETKPEVNPVANIAQTSRFEFLMLLFFAAFLFIFLIFVLFFAVYAVNMNKKIEKLILENQELAKRNILIDSSTPHFNEHFEKNKDKEVVMVDKSDSEISNILKKIDELDKTKKIKSQKKEITFNDLKNIPDKLFAKIIEKYDEKILSVAIIGASEDIANKIISNLIYTKQQKLKYEIEKNKDLQMITSEAILKMQKHILNDVQNMINSGEIDIQIFQ